MKAKDVNYVAKETLRMLLSCGIKSDKIENCAQVIAAIEGIEFTDPKAIQTRIDELLGDLLNRLQEDY